MPNTNKPNIKDILETMEYGRLTEDTKAAREWLKRQNHVICTHGVDKKDPSGVGIMLKDVNSGENIVTVHLPTKYTRKIIVDSLDESTPWNKSAWIERSNLMKKFAAEIEDNSELICQIESLTRGLLFKDTKKYGVNVLVTYIQYFANWTYSSGKVSSKATIVYATDNTCLGLLGFALGTALAHGCNIVLHVEPALSVCVALLIELSVKSGIPNGVLKLVPNNDKIWIVPKPAMLYLLGYSENQKLQIPELFKSKQVVAISNNKTPLIIFSNSDLDSACEAAVSATWEYGGMLPWAVDTVLVQEDVYTDFVKKLKRKLEKLHVGNGVDKLADISYPMASELAKLAGKIKDAYDQGIDVYTPNSNNSIFQPTLFIGMRVYSNNVLGTNKNVSPAITVLAFRTPKEAVALANNDKQGIAASVWCENISVINEVVNQLNVGNVWINSHGIIRPSVSFTSYKFDGAGYIGGSQGFYEYEDQIMRIVNSIDLYEAISGKITNAAKAQAKWSKLSFDARVKVFGKWALDLSNNKSEMTASSITDELIAKMHECIEKYSSSNNSTTIDNFDHIVKREAVGIVMYLVEDKINAALVLGALLLGNAVVLVMQDDAELQQSFSKFLPNDLLSTAKIPPSLATSSAPWVVFVSAHSAYRKFQITHHPMNDWDVILRRCTISKNIWIPVGDSI